MVDISVYTHDTFGSIYSDKTAEFAMLIDILKELKKITGKELIANGEVAFADTDDLTVEKKTDPVELPDDFYPGRVYYLAIEKPAENTAGDLTVSTYNVVAIDGVNERDVLHTMHTVEAITDAPTYRGFLIQGLGFGTGKIKIGFKFAADSGAITVKWALYK